jgi:hypothetical protein
MEVEVMSAMSKEYFSPARRLAWAMAGGLVLGGLFLSGGCANKGVDGGPPVAAKKFPGGGTPKNGAQPPAAPAPNTPPP